MAAPVAELNIPSSISIAVAATMKGSEVACSREFVLIRSQCRRSSAYAYTVKHCLFGLRRFLHSLPSSSSLPYSRRSTSSAGGVRSLTKALNTVHEVVESRPAWKRLVLQAFFAVSLAVALIIATALLLIGPWAARGWRTPNYHRQRLTLRAPALLSTRHGSCPRRHGAARTLCRSIKPCTSSNASRPPEAPKTTFLRPWH
jgi:hypothetical protein